jgi:RNA polymerase sigma factor (sigma-70 family)
VSRAALFTKHQGLANAIAREFYLPGADMDDVHQEARLALWVATGSYRPERGPFPPYARHAIRADLRDKVEAANRLKQRVLTDSSRDDQLELLQAPDVERIVVNRERLRDAFDDPVVRQRKRWREAWHRRAARA